MGIEAQAASLPVASLPVASLPVASLPVGSLDRPIAMESGFMERG
jgi:hypothetical protein